MTVVAPPTDIPGQALDAQIATVQALVTANRNPLVEYLQIQQLHALQAQAVDHYMVTGWLNAATIIAAFPSPIWDLEGQRLTKRVAYLQTLVNNPPTPPPGNAAGYGSAGWTTVGAAYTQMLYAKQIELVEHTMNYPTTTAAVMLSTLTGFQSFPFEYVFNSVGFTDAWLDD